MLLATMMRPDGSSDATAFTPASPVISSAMVPLRWRTETVVLLATMMRPDGSDAMCSGLPPGLVSSTFVPSGSYARTRPAAVEASIRPCGSTAIEAAVADMSSSSSGSSASTACAPLTLMPDAASESAVPSSGRVRTAAVVPSDALLIKLPLGISAARSSYSRASEPSPGCTVYRNVSVSVPSPPSYVAYRSGSRASASAGAAAPSCAPATLTAASNIISIPMTEPPVYVPSRFVDETSSTRTAVDKSGTIETEPFSDNSESVPGSPSPASRPPASLIVPPLSASASASL